MGISRPTPTWIEIVRKEYENSTELQQLMEKLGKGELDLSRYTKHDGILFYKGRFFIASASPLKNSILKQLHDNPLAGQHSGYRKTLKMVQVDFFRHGLRTFVESYVRECDVCQRMKGKKHIPCRAPTATPNP